MEVFLLIIDLELKKMQIGQYSANIWTKFAA